MTPPRRTGSRFPTTPPHSDISFDQLDRSIGIYQNKDRPSDKFSSGYVPAKLENNWNNFLVAAVARWLEWWDHHSAASAAAAVIVVVVIIVVAHSAFPIQPAFSFLQPVGPECNVAWLSPSTYRSRVQSTGRDAPDRILFLCRAAHRHVVVSYRVIASDHW